MTTSPQSIEPLAQRPDLQHYGVSSEPDGLLPWSFASQQLAAARNYWVSTTRPDGRPHATPVWGVWLNETLYFGAEAGSVKVRNLAANPALLVHLESGDDVVILEGEAEWLAAADPTLWARVADDYAAKYDGFRPDPPTAQQPFIVLRPKRALGWLEKDFVRSATRWRFGGESNA